MINEISKICRITKERTGEENKSLFQGCFRGFLMRGEGDVAAHIIYDFLPKRIGRGRSVTKNNWCTGCPIIIARSVHVRYYSSGSGNSYWTPRI